MTEPLDFRAPIDSGVTTSAPFIPTLEQAHHSATCVALYSRGATERQAIDFLYRETEDLRAALRKALENAPPPALDALAYARGRDDERARCARILQAECDKLVTAGMLRALASIHSGKAAT